MFPKAHNFMSKWGFGTPSAFLQKRSSSHMWWMSCVEKAIEEGHYVSAAPIQNKVI
jgi:hypothetical protein